MEKQKRRKGLPFESLVQTIRRVHVRTNALSDLGLAATRLRQCEWPRLPQARLILCFDYQIRRLDNTILRTSHDIRLPTIPEAPVGSYRRAATITMTQPNTSSFPKRFLARPRQTNVRHQLSLAFPLLDVRCSPAEVGWWCTRPVFILVVVAPLVL